MTHILRLLRPAKTSAKTDSMRCVLGVIGVAWLFGTAHGDGLQDGFGPREVAVGEAMRGGATGASAIGLNPAGLPLSRELVFEGGYGYRASDSASLVGVSACDSTNLMPGCFFYEYAGSSPELAGMIGTRSTHIGGLALSRQFVPRVMIGATTKYYHFDSTMTGEKAASGFVFDLGATVRMTQMINLGISAQNLFATQESAQFPRALGAGVLVRPVPTLTMSFDSRWKVDGEDNRARYGGGLEWFLKAGQNGYPIRIGGLRDNGLDATYVSGGLGFASMKWGLDVGARYQVKGGDELLVLASMRVFGPRMPGPTIESE